MILELPTRTDNVDYVNIYNRIAHGLKDDYVDECGHKYHVRAYLNHNTPKGIVVTFHGKRLGICYPSPEKASEAVWGASIRRGFRWAKRSD